MGKIKLFTIFAFVASVFVFTSCKKDKDDDSGKMQNVTLQGIVRDMSGSPLGGVRVVTGSLNTTTSSDGKFKFTQAEVVNKRAIIKFEKNGYFTLTRSNVKESDMFIEAVLYPQGNSDISLQTSFESSAAKTLEVSGMKVTLSASSLMKADGSAYSGTVKANMLYLCPNNENFTSMMPGGDLAAIRTDNSEVILISYGMTNVNLTDNAGNPLQIKNGSTAELTFPIPAGMESNPPATIPLWHFDEVKGIWTESGVATKQGYVYIGTVTHFSWVNLDVPAKRITIKGKLTDCNNAPIFGVKVTALGSNGSNQCISNTNGNYSIFVPENTPIVLTVLSQNYGNYENPVEYSIQGFSGGKEITQNFSLPCITYNYNIGGEIGYYPVNSANYYLNGIYDYSAVGYKYTNLSWNLTGGVLTISGSGAIPDFGFKNTHTCERFTAPWWNYKEVITKIIIGDSVTRIGYGAFMSCHSLTSITIPNSVKSIGKESFCGCHSLTSITIPNSVINIGYPAFQYVYGPTNVSNNGFEGAFASCGLTSVTIGNSVTSIGHNDFNYCSGLEHIYCWAENPPKIYLSTFNKVNKSSCVLHVPRGSKSDYFAASGWDEFKNVVEDL